MIVKSFHLFQRLNNQKSEMPAPLNSFLACQIVTLKNAGLSYQKIADELGLKAKSTAQSVYKRYIRNKLIAEKINWSSTKIVGKNREKIGEGCIEIPQDKS